MQNNNCLNSANEAQSVSTEDLVESTDYGCLLLANVINVLLISSAVSKELSVNAQCMQVSEGRIGTLGIRIWKISSVVG